MAVEKRLKNIQELLKKHNQSHLLAFWEQLSPTQRQDLLAQIEKLDFSKIDGWVANFVKNPTPAAISEDFAPACSYSPAPTDEVETHKYNNARELANRLISAGKVAAFVVAGGQGTRLGFDGPKGDFPISPVKNKTLFRIFAESIAAASNRYKTSCPWYIMTSPLNYAQTKEIFRSNDYYGLDKKNIFIFQQGTLPNFGFDGRILMANKAEISCSPDGHGGSLKALYKSGALTDMKKRGIEFISYFQVDNPLVNIFDPLFIGLHALDKAEMSSKAVAKTKPTERVGNFCLVADRVTVIEYSDMPDELARKRGPDGSLVFNLGSIAIHIINRSFVERLNTTGFALPLHRAVKKIEHIDHQGQPVEPTEPNGIKLESFIFDALPLASKSIILQTLRSEEFAPVKDLTGTSSPEAAKKMIIERAGGWLESAGCHIPRKPDGSADCCLEIAPSFALQKDDIKAKLSQIPKIKPNDKLYIA